MTPPEVRALNRLACLLDALHRWKLSAIACSQQQIDHWQATVMWPGRSQGADHREVTAFVR